MELRQLRYFVAVAEELNFRRAAERLNMAQPPLSQQIKNLEQELGVTLFRRTRHSVAVSEAGEVLLRHARQVLASADAAMQLTRAVKDGERGTLSIGAIYSVVHSIIPRALRAFFRSMPGIDVHVSEMTIAQQVAGLLDGKIQIGILRAPLQTPALRTRAVAVETLIAALPVDHPLAKLRSIPLEALARFPFLTVASDAKYNFSAIVTDCCSERGIRLDVVRQVSEMHTLIALVAAGMGVAIVPASLATIQLADVVYRPIVENMPSVSIALAWHRDFDSPALNRYLDLIETSVASRQIRTDRRGNVSFTPKLEPSDSSLGLYALVHPKHSAG